jgi:hypothetical protein
LASLISYLVSMHQVPSRVVAWRGSSGIWFQLPAKCRFQPVDVIDLGFGVLTVPAGEAQHLLSDLLSREDHAAFVESLSDEPDLATS